MEFGSGASDWAVHPIVDEEDIESRMKDVRRFEEAYEYTEGMMRSDYGSGCVRLKGMENGG